MKSDIRTTQDARQRRRDAGMTLIEVMLTMSTTAVAMLVLVSTLVSTQTLNQTVRDKQRALADVNALMEQMAIMPFNNVADAQAFTATFPHDTVINDFTNLHVRNESMRVFYDNGNINAVPLNYEVRCTWNTANGLPASARIRGVRSR